MKNTKRIVALLSVTALYACPAESHEAGEGPETIEGPAPRDVFRDINGDGQVGDPYQVGEANGQPIYETRYLFDDERLRELCLLPDADSFDDYEELDSATGRVIVARGSMPLSTECPADGIVTGPLHEELRPSSWCRVEGCVSDE